MHLDLLTLHHNASLYVSSHGVIIIVFRKASLLSMIDPGGFEIRKTSLAIKITSIPSMSYIPQSRWYLVTHLL